MAYGRTLMLVGVSAMAMTAGGTAVAQSAPAPAGNGDAAQGVPPGPPPADTAGATATDSQSQGATGIALQEIVVTALKRETSLQKTPLSIAAFGGADLRAQGKTTVQEVLRGVPNVELNGNGANGSFAYIRGVGNNPRFTGDPSVVVSVDGVFNQRGNVLQESSFDIQRIEVARGPQTTLTGRTAEGGAINVITNAPVLERFAAGATGTIGNAGLRTGEAYLNVPIGDTLALRAAVAGGHRDPLLADGTGGRKSLAGRARLLFRPSSDVKIILSGDHSQSTAPQSLNGANTGFIDLTQPFRLLHGGYYTSTPNTTTYRFTTTDLYADLDWNLGFATLHIQPTYQKTFLRYIAFTTNETTYQRALLTTTAQPVPYNNAAALARGTSFTGTQSKSNQKSLEIRLSSPTTSAFSWLAGLYYFTNTQKQSSSAAAGTSTGAPAAAVPVFRTAYLISIYPNSPHRKTTDYDAFAEGTYRFSDTTCLILGGRLSKAERGRSTVLGFDTAPDGTIINTNLSIPKDNGVVGTTTPGTAAGALGVPGNSFRFNILEQNQKFHDFNFRLVAEHDLAPRSLVYASISTGWKAGAASYIPADGDLCTTAQGCLANVTYISPGFSAAYKSEHLAAFEIGSKNTFADGRLRLNGSLFYYLYRNYQFDYLANYVNSATGVDPDYTATITANAKKAYSYGGEIEANYVVTSNDRINLTGGYLHARIRELGFLPGSPASFQAFSAAMKGFALPRSPRWSITSSYSHLFELGRLGSIEATGGGHYASKQVIAFPSNQLQLANPSYYQQGKFVKLDASLLFTPASKVFTVTAFVRNVTNKLTYDSKAIPTAFPSPAATAATGSTTASGSATFYPSEPRMYGLTVSANF